jgi:hypothetical protein
VFDLLDVQADKYGIHAVHGQHTWKSNNASTVLDEHSQEMTLCG